MSVKKMASLTLVFALGTTMVAHGANYTIKDGTTNWASPASYSENDGGGSALPGAGDTITVPADTAVLLDASDTSSWEVYEGVERVIPSADSSKLTIHVESASARVKTPYSASNENYRQYYPEYYGVGELIKTGDGELKLGSDEKRFCNGANCYDYNCAITINAGQVTLPQDVTTSGPFYYGPVTVSEGATLKIAKIKSGVSGVWASTTPWRLNGAGTVTADSSVILPTLSVKGWNKGLRSEFSGKLTGSMNLKDVWARLALTGTENSIATKVTVCGNYDAFVGGWWGGYIEVMKLGLKGQTSSLGSGSEFEVGTNGGGILYLGDGETCDKTFRLCDTIAAGRFCFIDAGANGGIDWTGEWMQLDGSAESTKTHRMLITGSNTTECVMSGKIADATAAASDGGRVYPIYIVKRGTGTWRMADNANRTGGGGYAVEEGTLRFDSIAEKGVVCSLGTANNLTESYTGTDIENHRVDYAYLLGTPEKEGTMEFSGAKGGSCSTRPVAVNGKGRFKVSGTGDFLFKGFRPFAADAVLTLDTSRAAADGTVQIGGLSDGDHVLSVVKEGSGEIALCGDNAFTGGLDVRAGTLRLMGAGRAYQWFKWTVTTKGYYDPRYESYPVSIKQAPDSTTEKRLKMEQFALFDADGKRLDKGLSFSALTSDFDQMPPKSVAQVTAATSGTSGKDISQWFNGGAGSRSGEWGGLSVVGGSGFCHPDNPDSWFTFVERLPDGSNPAASFDLATFNGLQHAMGGRAATAVRIEGSADGIYWEHILDKAVDLPDVGEKTPRWYANPSADLVTVSGVDYTLHDHVGYALNGASQDYTATFTAPIKVASGARLVASGAVTLSALEVSGVTNGTIDGCTFAETGTLNIVDLPKSVALLPVTFVNCTGIGNLSGWTLTVGGVAKANYSIRVTADGKLEVVRPGMLLIVK